MGQKNLLIVSQGCKINEFTKAKIANYIDSNSLFANSPMLVPAGNELHGCVDVTLLFLGKYYLWLRRE